MRQVHQPKQVAAGATTEALDPSDCSLLEITPYWVMVVIVSIFTVNKVGNCKQRQYKQ
jgi:hypothetical protein